MLTLEREWTRLFLGRLHAGGTKDEARDIATLRIAQWGGRKDLDAILTDEPFWVDLHDAFVKRMRPALEAIFLEGIRTAARLEVPAGRTRGKDILDPQPDLLGDHAGQAMTAYLDTWWRSLESSTRDGLRDAITRSAQDGTGVQQVIRDITPLFGRGRAELIGITETTRLFGAGAIATYRASGMATWIWRTVQDDRVCDICEPLAGQSFPISTDFQPAHPRCRCFPSPGEEAYTQPEEAPPAGAFPEAGFKAHADLRAFMEAKYPNTDWSFYPANKDLGLGGFSMEAANATARELDHLLEEYPFMKDRLGVVAQMDTEDIIKGAAHEDSYAFATWRMYGEERVYELRFNPNYYGDLRKLKTQLAKDIKGGWSPDTGDDIRSVATHEFGHLVDFALEAEARRRGGDFEAAYEAVSALFHDRELTRLVGEYASKNAREGWAEVFSMWAAGVRLPIIRARILAEKMEELIHGFNALK